MEKLSVCSMQSGESRAWKKYSNQFLVSLGRKKGDVKAEDRNPSLGTFL